jgi:hypothetical protein
VSAKLDLLRPPPDPAPNTPINPRGEDRKRKAREIQISGARRWIDAGKPIAIAVARKEGKVTAASFRKEAALRNALPPTYDNQRALGWISAMFNELVREGALEKARHENGAPVRTYGGRNNDQVVYIEGGK